MAEEAQSMNVDSGQKSENEDYGVNQIIDNLILNKDAFFKSQQRDENDLTVDEKRQIAIDIFARSKSTFLSRFGKQLKEEDLEFFNKYVNNEEDGYDIEFYLQNLKRYFSKTKRNMDIRNRRYDALNKLVQDNTYFSETEMMRRNPLLYEQLVGQYMSEDEKKKRDNIDTTNITFVNLLLEGIDRDATREKKKEQEKYEEGVMEEEEDTSDEEMDTHELPVVEKETEEEFKPSTSKWGEFEGSEDRHKPNISWSNRRPESPKPEVVMITASERRLLKEEFISIMYQNFIDGKDADFDYASVDNNEEFDNIEIKNSDAEEKYFDSESPEDVSVEDNVMAIENEDESEDELDIYMQRLNQHHSIRELSNGLHNL